MTTSRITSKGQITIPVQVRTALGLKQGDRVDFVQIEKGFAIVPATTSVKTLKGMIRKPKQAVSIDQMNAAIAKRGASAK